MGMDGRLQSIIEVIEEDVHSVLEEESGLKRLEAKNPESLASKDKKLGG